VECIPYYSDLCPKAYPRGNYDGASILVFPDILDGYREHRFSASGSLFVGIPNNNGFGVYVHCKEDSHPVDNDTAVAKFDVSQTEGSKLSHVGFEFEVPWNDLDAESITKRDNIAVFIFSLRNRG
jgi:hypothetical protein